MSIAVAISNKLWKHQKMKHLLNAWPELYHPVHVIRSSMACAVCHVLQLNGVAYLLERIPFDVALKPDIKNQTCSCVISGES